MPLLSEHWSDGGQWLPEGEHLVTVTGAEFVTFNSGNRGVEFTLRDGSGREGSKTFALVNEGNLSFLARFVADCGFTREQCRDYNTENLACHRRLVGRRLYVTVEKKPGTNGKEYREVTSHRKADAGNGATQKPWSPEPERRPAAAAVTPEASDDDSDLF